MLQPAIGRERKKTDSGALVGKPKAKQILVRLRMSEKKPESVVEDIFCIWFWFGKTFSALHPFDQSMDSSPSELQHLTVTPMRLCCQEQKALPHNKTVSAPNVKNSRNGTQPRKTTNLMRAICHTAQKITLSHWLFFWVGLGLNLSKKSGGP